MRDYIGIAHQYALDIISGAIPAAKVTIQAAKRQIRDIENEGTGEFPFLYNPWIVDRHGKEYQPANRICAFAEKLNHVRGIWKGDNFILEPWQIFLLCVSFGWVNKGTGLRRFREIYLEVPRKNGKSFLSAVICLYLLVADNESAAEIFSGANSQKQALHVFKPAWLITKAQEEFSNHYNLKAYGEKPDMGSVVCLDDFGKFEPLIGNPGDGDSPSGYACDEFHEHPDDSQYMTMTGGMGSRQQPMAVITTTAGNNIAGPCYRKRAQVVNIIEEQFVNDTIFGIIYTIDDEDDWTDWENWIKANPNFDVSVFADDLKALLLTALQDVSKQNAIRCKRLNQWMNVATAFFDIVALNKWHKERDLELSLTDFEGEKVFVGLDMASKEDLASKVKVFKKNIDGEDHYYAFSDFYLPQEATKGEDKTHYVGWANDGWLTITHGFRLDIDKVEEDLIEDAKKYEVEEVPHDPWNVGQMAAHMEDKGIKMVEINQTVRELSEPTKELSAIIRDGKFHYDGNPILRWCLSNVVCQEDTNQNVKPKKQKGQEHLKIDGAIALIMALKRAMLYIPKQSGNDGSLI